MADPLSAAKFRDAIKGEGVRVVEVGKWSTHNRGSRGSGWGPLNGVMIHHTVTSGTAASVRLCREGHSALPGPLCHGVIDKGGTVHLVGYGRANHAGAGDDDVLRAVVDERVLPADNEANTDGNSRFYGFECINLGNGRDPWPVEQVEAIARAAAGVCRAHGWNERSVIGHSEWQPGKVDPRGPIGDASGPDLTMDRIRDRVRELLGGDADSTPPPAVEHPDDGDDGGPAGLPRYRATINGLEYGYGAYGSHVTAVGRALVARGHGGAYEVGPGPRWTDADTEAYRSWQLALGYHGGDADGVPGESSLRRLLGSLPGGRPTVDS